jgi:hypothetical protein
MEIEFLFIGLFAASVSFFSGCFPIGTDQNQSQSQTKDNWFASDEDYNIDDLNSYGNWIVVANYGKVWQPSVVADWQPFYNGHWVFDGNNWVWESYEDFGWIVYHYGNWINTPDQGWVWLPGRGTWSPARVQWIQYGDMVGWAPMPAQGARLPEPWEAQSRRVWNVVRANDFNKDNVTRYRIQDVTRTDINNQARIIRNAPDRKAIEQRTNAPVPVVRIEKVVTRPVTTQPATVTRPVTPAGSVNRSQTAAPSDNRGIIRMKTPEQENKRIEPYRAKVAKDVIIRKNVKPVPKKETKDNNAKPAEKPKEVERKTEQRDAGTRTDTKEKDTPQAPTRDR